MEKQVITYIVVLSEIVINSSNEKNKPATPLQLKLYHTTELERNEFEIERSVNSFPSTEEICSTSLELKTLLCLCR